ncbi:MAG: RNA-binding S4 domain-containing protein [Burkholderiales bacterium]|nr:RNA-binding S4 domain-containing protein [Burkholderiales bacterium]
MSGGESADGARVRIDKWLWAARFFKTRSLAAQAVECGRVQVNGARVKPARDLKPGDVLDVRVGALAWRVEVRALDARRGPAASARALYVEDTATRTERERIFAARQAAGAGAGSRGRPSKRDRRLIRRFRDKD